ncbi:MAG: ATP-binding cassette domain-containing protein [Methanoculleus sp.]|jgi:ABC-2 type transport system ATP-binding protein|nr:ATP-binding cassette domain-containing protein [Methanomicrobiales archaeon]
MDAIEVIGLTKRFGDTVAVNGINFSVKEGETFGFLGPNGAGKTTTIRMLTGMTRITSGRALIHGHDIVSDTRAAKQLMGIVAEISNVYDELSAWDNVVFAGRLYHLKRVDIQRNARDLLETFELYERRHDLAGSFSKGMKRRLTLAMGLVNRPKVLFLDEPTSGLDVQSRRIIRDVIQDLARKNVTVFLTTHDIEEANVTCDRVAIINRGVIAGIDAPEKLKQTIESLQSVEVSFDAVRPGVVEVLRALPQASGITKEGDKFRIYTADPPEILASLCALAQEQNLRPISITTRGPSLEEVFVRLTGLSIDTAKEEGETDAGLD